MRTPWKKRLFKFSKKLVATLNLATLKQVIVLLKGTTESKSAINQKESSKIQNGGHSGDKQIFINHSLCPYYHVLWSKSKILLNMGNINRLMVSNGTLKVKISDISAPISITHADDFTKYFPDIYLSLSAQSDKSFQLVLLGYFAKY